MTRMATQERRDSILRATLEQIRIRGLSETRASDVAAALSISEPLVHYHFRSRERLVAAAYDLHTRLVLERLQREFDRPGSPIERLRRVIDAYLPSSANNEWGLWMEAWVAALHDSRMADTLRHQDSIWRETLARIIAEGVAEGSFHSDDPLASSWRITSLLDGLGVQLVAQFSARSDRALIGWFEDGVARELGLAVSLRLGE